MSTKMEVVILIGLQASGKSTFYKEKFYNSHIRINLDMLKNRNRENKIFQACIDSLQPVVIDNTNPDQKSRLPYITAAKSKKIKVIGYVFEPNLEECLNRNESRDNSSKIPSKGIVSTYKKLSMPLYEEGFDELFYVTSEDNDFEISPYTDLHKELKKTNFKLHNMSFDFSEASLTKYDIYTAAKSTALTFDMKYIAVKLKDKIEIEIFTDHKKAKVFSSFFVEAVRILNEESRRKVRLVSKSIHIQGIGLHNRERRIKKLLLRYPTIECQIFDHMSGVFGIVRDTYLHIKGLENVCDRFEKELVSRFPKSNLSITSL